MIIYRIQEGEQLEDRRNVGENSCNSGDGTNQTSPILDVYDHDDNGDIRNRKSYVAVACFLPCRAKDLSAPF